MLRTLLRRIPVTINFPALEDRPIDEKEQLIFSFIQNEAEQINKKIKVTQSYFQTLMDYRFRANVGELKSAIKRSCANAFLHQNKDSERLILKMFHLPENIISYSSFLVTIDEEGERVFPSKTKIEDGTEKIILLFNELLKENDLYMEYKNKNMRLDAYGTAMDKITEEICSRYKIKFQNNGLISVKLGY